MVAACAVGAAVASTPSAAAAAPGETEGGVKNVLKSFLSSRSKGETSCANSASSSGGVSVPASAINFRVRLTEGAFIAALLTTGKGVVVWCSKDSENSAALTDLGFLLCLGALGEAAIRRPALQPLQPVIVEIAVVHLFLELVFNAAVLRKIDPKTTYSMPVTMYIHHIASVVAGAICMTTYDGRFNGLGTKLAATECTTFLPVAFRQARKADKLRGDRSIVLGALMPIAFIWRTWWNFTVLTDFEKSVKAMRTCNPVVRALGVTATSTVLGCNCWWTLRILIGAKKIVSNALRRGGKKKEKEKDEVDAKGKAPANGDDDVGTSSGQSNGYKS